MPSACYSMVEVIGLSVVRGRTPILHDVKLTIPEGETVAFMGPNGTGKSTLLKCLAGALQPTEGKVYLADSAICVDQRRQIGFVGHETGLYGDLTALENLVFAARMYGLDCPHQRAETLIAEAALEPIAHRPAGQLSQGVQRRLAISRAMIHQPPLILLDEPFASLDSQGRRWLEHLFQRWRLGQTTVCFASHDVEQSRRLADRIIWLDAGRIAANQHLAGCAAYPGRSA